MIKIAIYGKGGDGAQVLADIIITAAMLNGFEISAYPIYDAAKRGGESSAGIIISKKEIINPIIENPLAIINLNTEIVSIKNKLAETDKESQAKWSYDKKMLGLFLFGVLVKKLKFIKEECVEQAIKQCVSEKFTEQNINAFKAGMLALKNQ
jgi:Pyruvate/2-oxoacid:ferredoxin oxidoreductase gamma subunit